MNQRISPDHPLCLMFHDLVEAEVSRHVHSLPPADILDYLVGLLVDFVRMESVFAIRADDGRAVQSVIEMVAEADIRLKASSFDRERAVHKHVGDYILFWSGVYPDFLRKLKAGLASDLSLDYTRQGRESYYLVSTFDHAPYAEEAETFRRLSQEFEGYSFVLGQVSRKANLYAN